jgi:hypothetical protein
VKDFPVQNRVNSLISYSDCSFNEGFIFRLIGSCRQYCSALMQGKVIECLVQGWFIRATFCNGTFKVIRNNGHRNTAVKLKCMLTAVYEVLFTLGESRFQVCQLACSKDRDKDLHISVLCRFFIYKVQFFPCKVNEHLIPGNMLYMHHWFTAL